MNEGWGVGDQADSKAFDTVNGGELIFGQYPHTRQDDNIYLRRPDGRIVPFDGFRRLINIEIESSNYEKESEWSGDEIRKSVTGKIIVDGIQLVEEFGRDPQIMMRRLDRLVDVYSEHASNWFSKKAREDMPGRKVWYHDQPATIGRIIEDQGCVIIHTEPGFVPPRQDAEDELMSDYWDDWKVDGHYEIKDTVLSPHIDWFRN